VKTYGIGLIILGAIWGVIALNMQTSVKTESGDLVHNLSLADKRRNHLFGAGITLISGILLFGFGSKQSEKRTSQTENVSTTNDDFEEKWITLINYDEGTKNAVKQLEVYGSDAIDELKKVLRATNDPTRLPMVVDKIAKDIQSQNEIKKQKLADENAREIKSKIEADKIRIAEQIAKEENKIIWWKRFRYVVFGIMVLSIVVCGFMAVTNKMAKSKAIARERAQSYTDSQTGLMWAGNGYIADKGMSWTDAVNFTKNFHYGDYTDWRLPSKEELEVLVKRGGRRPSEWFNANGLNNVQPDYYWSSSTDVNSTDGAWGVHMGYGFLYHYDKTKYLYVWPVRAVR
jgi:hypothetical protein